MLKAINIKKFNLHVDGVHRQAGCLKLPMVLIDNMKCENRRVYMMVKELAYECGVHQQTIHNIIRELKKSGFIVNDGYDWGRHYYELNKNIFRG